MQRFYSTQVALENAAHTILLHSALYTVSFYKALWTSGYTSRAIGWGNPLVGECVTLLSNSAVTIIEES